MGGVTGEGADPIGWHLGRLWWLHASQVPHLCLYQRMQRAPPGRSWGHEDESGRPVHKALCRSGLSYLCFYCFHFLS